MIVLICWIKKDLQQNPIWNYSELLIIAIKTKYQKKEHTYEQTNQKLSYCDLLKLDNQNLWIILINLKRYLDLLYEKYSEYLWDIS